MIIIVDFPVIFFVFWILAFLGIEVGESLAIFSMMWAIINAILAVAFTITLIVSIKDREIGDAICYGTSIPVAIYVIYFCLKVFFFVQGKSILMAEVLEYLF